MAGNHGNRTADRPLPHFNFFVEIDGTAQAGSSVASGFTADNTPIAYRESGENCTARKLPGMIKYNNIMLKSGLTNSHEIYEWCLGVVNGKIKRQNACVPRWRWRIKQAKVLPGLKPEAPQIG